MSTESRELLDNWARHYSISPSAMAALHSVLSTREALAHSRAQDSGGEAVLSVANEMRKVSAAQMNPSVWTRRLDAWAKELTAFAAEQPAKGEGEELSKLRDLCACAYQMAGAIDAPAVWLDALSDASNGTPLSEWRVQGDIFDALLPFEASQPSDPADAAYVECRECRDCGHVGLNDSPHGLAACHNCEWQGAEPAEDKCPGCSSDNCMTSACPKCGARYTLIADITLPRMHVDRAWSERQIATSPDDEDCAAGATPPTAQRHDEGDVLELENRARELLAEEWRKAGRDDIAISMREPRLVTAENPAIAAIMKALSAHGAGAAVEAVDAFGRTGPLLKGWDRLAREEGRPGHSRLTWAQAAADLRQVQMRNAALSTQPLLSDQSAGVSDGGDLTKAWPATKEEMDAYWKAYSENRVHGEGAAIRAGLQAYQAALHPEQAKDGDVSNDNR